MLAHVSSQSLGGWGRRTMSWRVAWDTEQVSVSKQKRKHSVRWKGSTLYHTPTPTFTLNKLSIRLLSLRGTCMCAHPQTCTLNRYCLSVYLSTLSDPNNWKTNVQTKTCTCSGLTTTKGWKQHKYLTTDDRRNKMYISRQQRTIQPYRDARILPDHCLSDRKQSQKTLFTIQLAKSVKCSSWNHKELIEPALTLSLVHHVWRCLPCGSRGDELQRHWLDRATLAPTWTEVTVHRANLGFSSQKVARKEKGHAKPY